MAVTAKMFGSATLKAFLKEINWTETGKIKIMLLSNSFNPTSPDAQDTHDYLNDLSAYEVTGATNYTAKALTNCTATYDGATNKVKLDADDVQWLTSTITAYYAIIYYDTGVASTSPLIGYIDFGGAQSSSNGTFQLTWNSAGIFEFTIAA